MKRWNLKSFMESHRIRISSGKLYLPALVILAGVLALLVFISLSTYHNLNRDRAQALGFLHRQGEAVLNTVQSCIRISAGRDGFDPDVMGQILKETASGDAVEYMGVLDSRGRFLIHTDEDRIDTLWKPEKRGDAMDRFSLMERTHQSTALYEMARPLSIFRDGQDGLNGQDGREEMLIVLGLRMAPFEAARRDDFHHAMIMVAIVGLLGAGNLFFIFVIIRYYVVQRRLKQSEEKARRAERLAAVGVLAAGVAHEVRNPLSSIRGFAKFLHHRLQDRPGEQEYAGIMVREIDRINRVVTDLLTFSRARRFQPVPADVENLVDHVQQLLAADAQNKSVSVEVSVAPETSPALLDEDGMTHALLNLMLNALQSTDPGGNIRVEAALTPDRKTLSVSVTDDGPGISPENREKIFDPFFTDRPSGTGLGLAIVHKIIEDHRGEIKVQSPPEGQDRGCRFILLIPHAAPDAAAATETS